MREVRSCQTNKDDNKRSRKRRLYIETREYLFWGTAAAVGKFSKAREENVSLLLLRDKHTKLCRAVLCARFSAKRRK